MKEIAEEKIEKLGINNPFWYNTYTKIILILVGALLTGAAWRIRGQGGWGSMWGMFTVGFIICLLIYYTFSEWKIVKSSVIGVSAFLMAITVGGWGTLNGQITGTFTYEEGQIFINPWSGVFWMLALGFGWAPFFGFMLGRLFSKKKLKINSLFIMAFSFIIGELIGDLWLAHIIIPKISPDTYTLFANQLTTTTPWQEYLAHFRDAEYFADILGIPARNYESMVANFSSCTGALTMWIVLKFILKDKKGASIMIWVCIIIAISITVADLWIYWGRGGFHKTSLNPPTFVANESWSLWEYFTGFFIGGGVIWLLLSQKPNNIVEVIEKEEELIPITLEKFLSVVFTYLLMLCFTLVRPIGSLFPKRFPELINSGLAIYIVGALISLIPLLLYELGKFKLPKWSFSKYCIIILIIYVTITAILQQTLGYTLPRESLRVSDYLVIISVIISIPLLYIVDKKRTKEKWN
jgi:hypothetical protein